MGVKTRSDARVTVLSRCVVEIEGRKYEGLVENLSTVGAQVRMDASKLMYINVGDSGKVKVFLLSPVNYLCTVVRKDSSHIGLQFGPH